MKDISVCLTCTLPSTACYKDRRCHFRPATTYEPKHRNYYLRNRERIDARHAERRRAKQCT